MVLKALPQEFNPPKIDDWVFRFWEEKDIYRKVVEKIKKGNKWYFLDGPPYVTNPIHVGNAWNKIIKDAILRYKRMRGFYVWDKPGYDMHGLPIEVQVEKSLGFKTKKDIIKYGIDNFIRKCKEWALKNLKIQEDQFKNLGVWMDWEHPYKTIDNAYIEAAWYFIKKAEEKGLLAYGLKVVHWCPRCETVLSGYEVVQEYKEVKDPSIYVKFPLIDVEGNILIWTTTPWTLPANVAVLVHPEEYYVKAKSEDGDIVILAEKRLNAVQEETGKKLIVLERIKGNELEGLRYKNPLEKYVPIQKDLPHRIILNSEFVTMDMGTGVVHTAPGHGEEDWEVGVEHNLPAPSPVNDSGMFTDEAGKYSGIYVFESNKIIIKDLEELGALFYSGTIVHSYPHCWRCKSPLILRASKQWFIKVSEIRDELVSVSKSVRWKPEWALETRFIPWLKNAKDWAISRQRYWGIPLPIWICKKCNKRLVIGSFKELKELSIKMPNKEPDLHKPWIDGVVLRCTKCGGEAYRVGDVLDVWVDSGVASWGSLGYPNNQETIKKLWPVDFIVEGPDQIRGWFYSLLTAGYITFGEAPYKSVLMHGWGLDERGIAMHKSLGNVIYPEEVIHYGRDSLRVFELSTTTWENLRFSESALRDVNRILGIIWNTYRFASLYMNIDNFIPRGPENIKEYLRPEDKWLLSIIQSLIKSVTEFMDNYEIHEAIKAILEFLVEHVSRWYIRLIRRRVWIEIEDPDKIAAYETLYYVLDKALRLLAPFAPFMTEYIYQFMFRDFYKLESVHMTSWPTIDEKWLNHRLEKLMNIAKNIVTTSNRARQSRGIKLRVPVRRVIIASNERELRETIKVYRKLLLDQLNTKEIHLIDRERADDYYDTIVKLNYRQVGPILKDLTKEIELILQNLDGKSIRRDIEENGYYKLKLKDGREVILKKEMLIFEEKLKDDYAASEFENGVIFIDLKRDKKLEAETLARELIRRIQYMRKKLDLNVEDYILVTISVPGPEEEHLIIEEKEYISGEVRALELKTTTFKIEEGDLIEKWNIDGEEYIISVSKVR